jgi:hypothetical protein
MSSDHGGSGPPMVDPYHDPNNSTKVECTDDYNELLRKFRESLKELDELMQGTSAPLKILELPSKNCPNQSLDRSNDSMQILSTTDQTILPSPQKSDNERQQEPPAGANKKTTKTAPSSKDKSWLIVRPLRFPDPKNCAIFSQTTTQEDAPCWFHTKSSSATLPIRIKHEVLERGPARPHNFYTGASLPTTQSFARTLGATCSAKHYHAFRRPPPARDKNQARRIPQTQAMHNNEYFKMPRRATKFKLTHFKLTRGATLRKEHYQAFRKPPPTRDRKQEWTMKHHE